MKDLFCKKTQKVVFWNENVMRKVKDETAVQTSSLSRIGKK